MWKDGRKIKVCKVCGKEGHTPFQCPVKKLQSLNKPKTSKPIKKKSNRSKIIHELDKLYSEYHRKLACSKTGYCYCFICGKRLTYEQSCIGHYISRRYINLRFNHINANVICYDCNRIDKDQPEKLKLYGQRIIERYGADSLIYLNSIKEIKVSTQELKSYLNDYKRLYSNLK